MFGQAAGLVFDTSPWLSVLNWIHLSHSDRGVGHWLWFGCQLSNLPAVLCEGSQDILLQRSGHIWVSDCQLWAVEALKVRGMSGQ